MVSISASPLVSLCVCLSLTICRLHAHTLCNTRTVHPAGPWTLTVWRGQCGGPATLRLAAWGFPSALPHGSQHPPRHGFLSSLHVQPLISRPPSLSPPSSISTVVGLLLLQEQLVPLEPTPAKRLGKHGSKEEKSLPYKEMSQPSLLPVCHPRQAAFQLFSSKYLQGLLSNTLSQPSQSLKVQMCPTVPHHEWTPKYSWSAWSNPHPPHSAALEAARPVWPVSVPGSDLGALAHSQTGWRLGPIDR